MRIKKTFLGMLVLWCSYLVYFIFTDVGSFWISLVLTPSFGLAVYLAYRTKNLVLQLFSGLCFVGHAVGAPYFWMIRGNYSYSGWAAVRSFDFNLVEFFVIYGWVISLVYAIVILVIAFDRFKIPSKISPPHHCSPQLVPHKKIATSDAAANNIHHGGSLMLLLVMVLAVPLNVFMALNRIGINGIVSEPLPFHLVGIMYYGRFYVIPLILTGLYFMSSRSRLLFSVVALYSIFAGVSSASRSVMVLSFFPLLMDVILTKSRMKIYLTCILAAISFVIVSASREYTYSYQSISYADMAISTLANLADPSQMSPVSAVGNIANRLYSAQDMILAYQYSPEAPFDAFLGFWITGKGDAVVPDMAFTLFDLVFEKGTAYGVAIGLIAYLLILGRASVCLLILGPVITAILISLGNRFLNGASSYVVITLVTPVRYFAALLLAFSIYSSGLLLYYSGLVLLIVFVLIMRLMARRRIASKPYAENVIAMEPAK